ncbi:YrzI family small protein [Anaerobacillus arseniciselenatis]|uniref:YrzI family small protein n=1 Tax=Anaerobacillus arseniciselenatis TaxID=85682 RepID=UPI000A06CB55|nr:YrzI family small protein [Anaerobacillus arseniciselenatis]
MLFNLFAFTITVSKRQYSKAEINKANHINQLEAQFNELKSKQMDQHVWNYLGRM